MSRLCPILPVDESWEADYRADPVLKDIIFTPSGEFREPSNFRHGRWWVGDRVAVPESRVSEILTAYHDGICAGHWGAKKTHQVISRDYSFPNMFARVQHHVRTCPTCQSVKAERVARRGLLHPLPLPAHKWQSVSIDWIHLPLVRGFNGAITFTDRATKMLHVAPVKMDGCSAEQTAHIFYAYVVRYHGLPRSIICDRDSRFLSAFWTSLADLAGIKMCQTSSHHPEANGQAERSNQTLKQVLRAAHANGQNWLDALISAEIAINNAAIHASKYSPFYLNLGYHPTLLSDVIANGRVDIEESASEFVDRMKKDFESAQTIISEALNQQKVYADRHRSSVPFAVGQYVGVRVFPIARPALCSVTDPLISPRWVGPFKIIAKVSPTSFTLQLPDSVPPRFCRTFHASVLKPWYLRESDVPPAELEHPLVPSNEERFEDVLYPGVDVPDEDIPENDPHFWEPVRESPYIPENDPHFWEPVYAPQLPSSEVEDEPVSQTAQSTSDVSSVYVYNPRDDIMLDPRVFRAARKFLKFKPSADLFASAAHHQLPRYYSPFPDPMSAGTDAFAFCWQQERAPYVNPPWPLISRALNKIVNDRVKAMVVIPKWPSTEWWPLFSRIILRAKTYDEPLYLDVNGNLRPPPKWLTVIAVVDGSLEPCY